MYFQVPRISISPAPPEEPAVEPYSPFTSIPQVVVDNHDGFRPVLLTPPPTAYRFQRGGAKKHVEDNGIGLESLRFQQLLKATRDRNASVDLRKELAVKIQTNRQSERRALFLSKVKAPPSPTAATTPKTPPESPSVFHYTLPSPGLVSPLTVFESVDKYSCEGWVEKVYFEKQCTEDDLTKINDILPEHQKSRPRIPSLEQISARMIPSAINPSDYDVDSSAATSAIITKSAHMRPLIGVGRLRMPLRASQPPQGTLASSLQPFSHPELRVAAVVDNTADSVSVNSKLTETNLNTFNIRGQRAHDMLCTLRKRTSSFVTNPLFYDPDRTEEATKFKRHSAPAELTSHPRVGFAHPVLAMPGSF